MALIPSPTHPAFLNLRDKYLKYRLFAIHIKNRVILDNPPQICKIISVDPADITRTISWNCIENRKNVDRPEFFDKGAAKLAGTIRAGDWDKNLKKFEDCVVYRSFVSHFVQGALWEETDLYQESINHIKQNKSIWGCESDIELRKRFKNR